jgi:hypothetical protein
MGVASLATGQIEHMLIRRLVTSDNQGPAPLNEITPINVTVALFLSTAADSRRLMRALELEHPLAVVPISVPPAQSSRSTPATAMFSEASIPESAHLLSLSVLWGGTSAAGRTPLPNSTASLIVRWMNTAESGPPITVPLGQFVQNLTGSDDCHCSERTLSLTGDRDAMEAGRLHWGGTEANATLLPGASGDECGEIELLPLDIRTFEVEWPSRVL